MMNSNKIKVLIFDLDNTIYPVSAIGEEIFAPLWKLLKEKHVDEEVIYRMKPEVMRRPFHDVAADFELERNIAEAAQQLLAETEYAGEIQSFEGYEAIRSLPVHKYLVTTGFSRMQNSKIDALGIRGDFREVMVIDPMAVDYGKKEVFRQILEKEGIAPEEALVIGDDPGSEIQAADSLGIGSAILDPSDRYTYANADFRARSLKEILNIAAELI